MSDHPLPGPESDAEQRTALDRCNDLEAEVDRLREVLRTIAHAPGGDAAEMRSLAAAVLRL